MARQATLKTSREAPKAGEKARLRLVVGSAWLDQVLEDFERAMLRRDYSPATVRTYRWAIEDLFGQLRSAGVRQITELSRQHLEHWQDTMVQRKWRPRSRVLAITACKQLIRWGDDRDLLNLRLEKALERVKAPEGHPRPLPEADLATLKAYLLPRRPNMGIVPLRDRALFFFFLTTGARVSEALQLRRDDLIDPVVTQKGGTEKTLMMPPAALEMIQDYLRARHDESPWVWITHKSNGPLTQLGPPGVREVWAKLARKLKLKRWTTHQLRHSCATEMLNAGVPELVIAEHLGHHGLGTIHNYGQVRATQRQRAVDVMGELIKDTSRPVLLPKLSRSGRY